MPNTVAAPITPKASEDTTVQTRMKNAIRKITESPGPTEVKKEIIERLMQITFAKNHKEEASLAATLRKYIDIKVIANETPETTLLCDNAFLVQLFLTRYWPVNDKENGKVLCNITFDTIDANDQLLTSNGRILSRKMVNPYYATNSAYEPDEDNPNKIIVKTPDGPRLTLRDIEYLTKHGVAIFPPSKELREALELARGRGQGGEPINISTSNAIGVTPRIPSDSPFLNFIFSLLRYRDNHHIHAFAYGAYVGGSIGLKLGSFISYFAFIAVSLTLALEFFPYDLIAASISSLIEGNRKNGGGFTRGFLTPLVAIALTSALITLVAPWVIAGLYALTLISSVASATAAFYAIMPFIPLAIGAVGVLLEVNKPGAMQDFFASVNKTYDYIASQIAAMVLGILSGLVTLAVYTFTSRSPSEDEVTYYSPNIQSTSSSTILDSLRGSNQADLTVNNTATSNVTTSTSESSPNNRHSHASSHPVLRTRINVSGHISSEALRRPTTNPVDQGIAVEAIYIDTDPDDDPRVPGGAPSFSSFSI